MNNMEQSRVAPPGHPVYIHVHDVLRPHLTDGQFRSTACAVLAIHALVNRAGIPHGVLREIFTQLRQRLPFSHIIASVGAGRGMMFTPEDVTAITDEHFEAYEPRIRARWLYGPILQDDNPQQPTLTTAVVREINRRVRIPLLSGHQSEAVRYTLERFSEVVHGMPVTVTTPGRTRTISFTQQHVITLRDDDGADISMSPMIAERINQRLASANVAGRVFGISDEQQQRERIRKEVAKLPIKRIKELQAEQDKINLYEKECEDRAEKRREHRTLTIYQDEFFVYQEAVGNYLLHLSGSWREKPTGEGYENECFMTKKLGTGFKREWLPTDYLLEGCNEIQPEKVPDKWLTAWSSYWKRELKRNGQWWA